MSFTGGNGSLNGLLVETSVDNFVAENLAIQKTLDVIIQTRLKRLLQWHEQATENSNIASWQRISLLQYSGLCESETCQAASAANHSNARTATTYAAKEVAESVAVTRRAWRLRVEEVSPRPWRAIHLHQLLGNARRTSETTQHAVEASSFDTSLQHVQAVAEDGLVQRTDEALRQSSRLRLDRPHIAGCTKFHFIRIDASSLRDRIGWSDWNCADHHQDLAGILLTTFSEGIK